MAVGDVLSQSEIDALLSAISTGQMDADELKKEDNQRKVRVYDFKRALRFSKDHMRSLSRIHENFSRLLTTYFSAQLRTYVNISVMSVDQLPYEEFISSIPKMTILNIFDVAPLEGRIMLEVNPNIAYTMLDRVLGGRGASYNKIDSLTEIETKIMKQLFERCVDSLQESWSSVIDIDPSFSGFEVNPQFLQIVSPNETVVVISLSTQVGDTTGMINICIPHVVLEPILPNLSVKHWMQTVKKERNEEEVQLLANRVKNTEVVLSAQLGESTISIQDFLHLQMGDVITLEKDVSKPLTICVGDQPKYVGQPGKVNKKLAVQIIDSFRGGERIDE
ncbi:flagellar motor switch protein FliM [Priestia taiwanensis]|uniref:Flagellar motor switch protein FliM n=1 Tax=Priestia taiwanensis TaxID=1347902 RepID=A0A917APD6_9BACI|nr:flagellar motor switch protein FliM [Priestia taiwanensis]MBM7362833.1 flagellar motor switch protein FliM [Priestia taiwanensis]GGE65467.1 flagellar motor switch protein FliM [Priestia taiwanensis]